MEHGSPSAKRRVVSTPDGDTRETVSPREVTSMASNELAPSGTAGQSAPFSDTQLVDRIVESIAVRFNSALETRQRFEDGLPPPDYHSEAGQ